MSLDLLINDVVANTLSSLWPAFAPELILCGTILVLLLVRLLPFGERIDAGLLMLVGSGLGLYYAYPWIHLQELSALGRQEIFTGMLVYDGLTVYLRAFLLLFALLFVVLTKLTRVPYAEDETDFYCLIAGATLGMCLMASANHLLMVFMAVEMASVPSYALAGIMKGRRDSSEAALKYSIYGAGASGVMLYGISLLAGLTNSAHLPTIAAELAQNLPAMGPAEQMVLVLAGLMIAVGLAFKLSAVPFHFWCPDVFEGATAEVGAFLSVASKAAALALLIRVCVGVGMPAATTADRLAESRYATRLVTRQEVAGEELQPHAQPLAQAPVMIDTHSVGEEASTGGPGRIRTFIGLLVGILAAVTCTFGNLAAFGQTNIKRLMAYSTIAHAGYMMMPIPAAMALAAIAPADSKAAIASILLYAAVYLFMNLGAFAFIAILRNQLGTEQIADYGGLIRRAPVTSVCFVLILFSLVGLPPLAGFVGKFALFASLANAYQTTGRLHLILLLVVGGLNTAISLFYYLRVAKIMTIDPESDLVASSDDRLIPPVAATYVILMTAPVVVLIVNWNMLGRWTFAAVQHLFA